MGWAFGNETLGFTNQNSWEVDQQKWEVPKPGM
jgi:hypothetical protein